MLTNTSIWKAQIFKKYEKVKVWKFSHLKKSATTFAQGCTDEDRHSYCSSDEDRHSYCSTDEDKHAMSMSYNVNGMNPIIVSNNGLSPGRHQTIIWINSGPLLIGPLHTFQWKLKKNTIFIQKTNLKLSSTKYRSFCASLNALMKKSDLQCWRWMKKSASCRSPTEAILTRLVPRSAMVTHPGAHWTPTTRVAAAPVIPAPASLWRLLMKHHPRTARPVSHGITQQS